MVKKDTVQVTLLLDGKQPINQLGKLEMEYADIRREQNLLSKSTKKWKELEQQRQALLPKLKKERQELGLQGMTLQQLIRHTRELNRERSNHARKGTAEYKKLTAEIRKATAMIRQQKMEARGMNTTWSKFGSNLKMAFAGFGIIGVVTTAVYALQRALRSMLSEAIDLSDKFADVRKNTELTASGMDKLYDSLINMDTRSTRKELLDLAIVAGKLGIRGVRDIEAFVSAADKINVALGEDLGDVNETMKALGKLVNVFQVDEVFGIEDSLIKVGSAINDLGRSSVAQEKNIVDFTRRMGGIAPVAKVSIQDIMGLGAAGDSLGLTMEVMGTAMSQVFTKMTSNRAAYSKFAKDTEGNQMSLKEFTHLINTDFNSAILAVFRGLRGNNKATTEFIDSLGDMGLEGQRVTQVVSALAMGVEDIVIQQDIANKSFETGASVLDEFALKNETAGAMMSKIWKRLSSVIVNSGVISALESMLGWMERITRVDMASVLREEQIQLNYLVRAIQNANTPQDVRNRLIADLQEKYPNFLENMDAEKVTAEQLGARLKEVNSQYEQKILNILKEEETKEILKKRVELQEEEKKLVQELEAAKEEATRKTNALAQASLNHGELEKIRITSSLNLIRKQMAVLDSEFSNLDEKYTAQGLLPGTDTTNTTPTPDAIIEDLVRTQVELQKKGYKELSDQREIDLDLTEKFEKQKTQMTETQEKLRRESRKLGFELQLQQYEALSFAFGGVANAFGGMSDFIGDETERNIRNQVFFKQAAIFASQAQSMAAAIAGATEAAAASGPAAPFVLAGYIASMVGTVLSAFGQIKSVKKQADASISQMQERKERENSGRSYYHGGETGYGSMGMGDKYGPFTGYTHQGELVVPQYARTDPKVIDAEKVIKARMAGYTMGGGSTSHNVSLDANAFAEVVDRLGEYIGVLVEQGVEAHFSRYGYRKAKEDFEKKENASSRGSL